MSDLPESKNPAQSPADADVRLVSSRLTPAARLVTGVLPALRRLRQRNTAAAPVPATIATNVVILFFGVVSGVVAARLLGPQGRGELAAAMVWSALLTAVTQVGFPQALTFVVARDRQSVGLVEVTVAAIFLAQVPAAVAVAAVAMAILERARFEVSPAIRIAFYLVPATLVCTYVSAIMQGLGRFGLWNVTRVIAAAAYPVALVMAAFWDWTDVPAILIVAVLCSYVAAVVSVGLLVYWAPPRGRVNRAIGATLVHYGVRTHVGNLAWFVNSRLDQMVMSLILPLSQLGIYAVAVSYAGILFPLSGAFGSVLFSNVAGGPREDGPANIRRSLRTYILLSAALSGALGILAPGVLPLAFGRRFQSALPPALILLVGAVFLGANFVVSDGIRGLGHPARVSVCELAGLAITGVGLVVLVPILGIVGAAIASLFSCATVHVLLRRQLRRPLGVPSGSA